MKATRGRCYLYDKLIIKQIVMRTKYYSTPKYNQFKQLLDLITAN